MIFFEKSNPLHTKGEIPGSRCQEINILLEKIKFSRGYYKKCIDKYDNLLYYNSG